MKTKTKKIGKGAQRLVTKKVIGDEPGFVIDETRPLTRLELNKALNYYSCIDDQLPLARSYMGEFIKFMEWEYNPDNIPDMHFPRTASWIARLLMLGVELPSENNVEYIEDKLNAALSKNEKNANLVPLFPRPKG